MIWVGKKASKSRQFKLKKSRIIFNNKKALLKVGILGEIRTLKLALDNQNRPRSSVNMMHWAAQ